MLGDVLFWPSDGSPVSRIIALATRGRFVHVSVDMDDGTDIGAHSQDGTQRRIIPSGALLVRFRPPAGAAIERGITFLLGEIGNPYGFCNIVNVGLALLHLPYRLTRLDAYDCSSLVTRYLTEIGVNLGDLGEEPDSVSPNDIARALKVL